MKHLFKIRRTYFEKHWFVTQYGGRQKLFSTVVIAVIVFATVLSSALFSSKPARAATAPNAYSHSWYIHNDSSSAMKFLFVIIGVLLLTISTILPFSQPAKASTYSCGNPSSGHCYAIDQLSPGIALLGGSVYINTTQLSPGQNGSGWFLTNEEWLVQTSACSNGEAWVEAGTIAIAFNTQQYFWADRRPFNCAFYSHYLGNVPSADYGQLTYYDIWQADSSDWDVYINSYTQHFSATSTSNTMAPNFLNQGMELAGQSGSSAPATSYTERMYRTASGWHPIGNLGYNWMSNPPDLHVTNSPQTGDFYTDCCIVNGVVSKAPQLPTQSPIAQITSPTGSHIIDVSNTNVTGGQATQYAITHGVSRADVNGPITVKSVQLLTSAQIAVELQGEQTGLASDHVFWFLRISGQFHLTDHNVTMAYNHGVLVIDPSTGNLVLDGLEP